jgi:predicted ArsR family transcriptional regulator
MGEAGAGPGGDRPQRAREITDARAMRALAHPLRWALIDLLSMEGTATATRCGEVLAESQASCSFHLRQLARYGFVEEAPTTSKRERPWRLTNPDQHWSSVQPDEERALAAAELGRVFVEREIEKLRTWVRTSHAYPEEWRRAAVTSGAQVWMTVAELAEVRRRLVEFAGEIAEHDQSPEARPPGARPVRIFLAGFPLPAPGGE